MILDFWLHLSLPCVCVCVQAWESNDNGSFSAHVCVWRHVCGFMCESCLWVSDIWGCRRTAGHHLTTRSVSHIQERLQLQEQVKVLMTDFSQKKVHFMFLSCFLFFSIKDWCISLIVVHLVYERKSEEDNRAKIFHSKDVLFFSLLYYLNKNSDLKWNKKI